MQGSFTFCFSILWKKQRLPPGFWFYCLSVWQTGSGENKLLLKLYCVDLGEKTKSGAESGKVGKLGKGWEN